MSLRGGGRVVTVMAFRLADHVAVRWVAVGQRPGLVTGVRCC